MNALLVIGKPHADELRPVLQPQFGAGLDAVVPAKDIVVLVAPTRDQNTAGGNVGLERGEVVIGQEPSEERSEPRADFG